MSFYIHNSVNENIDISLELSKDDKYDSKKSETAFVIDKTVD